MRDTVGFKGLGTEGLEPVLGGAFDRVRLQARGLAIDAVALGSGPACRQSLARPIDDPVSSPGTGKRGGTVSDRCRKRRCTLGRMPPYPNLLIATDRGVTVVTVNRPGKLNALDGATVDALDRFFLDAGEDDGIRAIIVTGSGDRSFVAGADIDEVSGFSALEARAWGLRGQAMLRRVESLRKPVIAAINGYALGGGLELAMACHLRVASSRARLGQPELRLGIVPGFGGTQRLPRLVGRGRALEMLLTGDPVSADEAQAMGLVNRVAEPERLLADAAALAARILRNGPVAVALTLQAVDRGLAMPLDAALDWEVSQYALSCATDDVREGTRAFLEKRGPAFSGR